MGSLYRKKGTSPRKGKKPCKERGGELKGISTDIGGEKKGGGDEYQRRLQRKAKSKSLTGSTSMVLLKVQKRREIKRQISSSGKEGYSPASAKSIT